MSELNIRQYFETLRTSQRMRAADLMFYQLNPDMMADLSDALNENQSITRLNLAHTQLNTEGLNQIIHILARPQLHHLDLSHNRIIDYAIEKLNAAIGEDLLLREINLSFNKIGDRGLMAMTFLKHCPQLMRLNLSHNQFSDEGCQYLAETLRCLPELRELKLSQNNITKNGLAHLYGALCHCPKIKVIDLSGCKLDDTAFKYLIDLASKSSLDSLELGNNFISDEGVKALCQPQESIVIRSLNIANNRLSSHGIDALLDYVESHHLLRRLVLLGNHLHPEQAQRLERLMKRNHEFYKTLLQIDRQSDRFESDDIWGMLSAYAKLRYLPQFVPKEDILKRLKNQCTIYYYLNRDLNGLLFFHEQQGQLSWLVDTLLFQVDETIMSPSILALLYCRQADDLASVQHAICYAFRQLKISQGCHLDNIYDLKSLTGFDFAISYANLMALCEQMPEDPQIHKMKWIAHKCNPQELLEFFNLDGVRQVLIEQYGTNQLTLIEHLILYSEYYPIYPSTLMPAGDREISLGGFQSVEQLQKKYFAKFEQFYLAQIPQFEQIIRGFAYLISHEDELEQTTKDKLHALVSQQKSFTQFCVDFINWCWVCQQSGHDEQHMTVVLDLALGEHTISSISSQLLNDHITDEMLKRIKLQYQQSLSRSFLGYRRLLSWFKTSDDATLLEDLTSYSPRQRFRLVQEHAAYHPRCPLKGFLHLTHVAKRDNELDG